MEQDHYQVRFDWGVGGARVIGVDADVLVWVDVIAGRAAIDVAALPGSGAIVTGDFASAAAVARWIVDRQKRLARRVVIAVVAAGVERPTGHRFAVEDLLAAGAIIRSLGELGLDATSPEAAATEAAYLGLRRGIAHLVSASVTATTDGTDATDRPVPTRVDPDLGPDEVRVLRLGV